MRPAGPLAARIESLWWLFFWTSLAVYLIVIVFLLFALLRRRRADPGDASAQAASERRAHRAIALSVGSTVAILLVLGVGDFVGARAVHAKAAEPLQIFVTGRQWWWDIEYDGATPQERVRTANELHVPEGRPVELVLTSHDVIHSFWVPSLQGKMDLIPGRVTRLRLDAGEPGIYEGQCAEYCGYQHANMRLVVHVQSAGEFEAWRTRQRAPGRAPATPQQQRGQDVFLRSACALCHAIGGTRAAARVGPDLTHLASRTTLAAGILPNTKGHLGGWIADPQRLKPHSQMPSGTVAPQDLEPLLEYLTSLQ